MKEKEQGAQERQKSKQELHIHIERWQDIVDVLDDNKKVFRLVLVVVIIGLALFAGVSFIAIQLKKAYTYSDITTNALGATTLKDEQKEVSYFLFNTATLWANSGITVDKGDVLSVHSSGTAHTAIHHLHKAAGSNFKPDEEYFDANGERVNYISERDKARRKFRIVSDMPNSALVMQVYKGADRPPLKPENEEEEKNFYFISQHRENIIINEGGTLYFAINDIVLDSATIKRMLKENYKLISDTAKKMDGETNKDFQKRRDFIKTKSEILLKQSDLQPIGDKEAKLTEKESGTYRQILRHTYFQFGPYYNEKAKKQDTLTIKTEMDYYLENKYPKAGYDDNVGSFLIIVEKNYRK